MYELDVIFASNKAEFSNGYVLISFPKDHIDFENSEGVLNNILVSDFFIAW